MLYLYGDSGTTYLYIHLNNDVTAGNDNRGKCVAGGSYWPGRPGLIHLYVQDLESCMQSGLGQEITI